jgi:hypothetical protein
MSDKHECVRKSTLHIGRTKPKTMSASGVKMRAFAMEKKTKYTVVANESWCTYAYGIT